VHFKRADGLTEDERIRIFLKVEDIMHTTMEELLQKHQHLLETNFEALGSGSTSARQFWIVSIESAISAVKMASSGRVLPGQMGKFNILQLQRVVQDPRSNRSTVSRHTHRHHPTSSSLPVQ